MTELENIINGRIKIINSLIKENREEVIQEILKGLSAENKYISSKFFYDSTGSALFEKITHLSEYYPTSTEKKILHEMVTSFDSFDNVLDVIELGSGDCSKISILLKELIGRGKNINYIPVDVSEDAILKSARMLAQIYPNLSIHGLLADFTKHLNPIPYNNQRLICFFGSTIGNLHPNQSSELFFRIKALMKPGDLFYVGYDMVKDKEIIEKAYNDIHGITARFNKNILNVINHYVDTDFDTDLFTHVAFFNTHESRIEMHLQATADMEIGSKYLPNKILVKEGETIHTENSYKFTLEKIHEYQSVSGLQVQTIHTDKNKWFSVVKYVCVD